VAQGGYVPLILAALVYGVMLIWHVGATAVSARLQDEVMSVGAFLARIREGSSPRVPGTAVFLTRTQRDVPPVTVWYVKHNRALHEKLFVLTVDIEPVPWVKHAERLTFEESIAIAKTSLRAEQGICWRGSVARLGARM
jgi:KUP system potassium uptake protein